MMLYKFRHQRVVPEELERQARERETIDFLYSEYERRKYERLPYEMKWTLCANFFMGNQYCDINPYRGMGIEQFPVTNKSREREVYNRIAPIIETRVANLQKITYALKVSPRRDDIDDCAKAEVSTKILRHWQDVTHFDSLKNKALMWEEITGNGFWVCGWNSLKGKVKGRKLITEKDAEGYCEKIIDVHEGDVDYGLVSAYEVYPEDCMIEGVENQPSMMIVQVMSAREVYDRYGFKCDGSSIQTFTITPKPLSYGMEKECTGNTLSTSTKENAVKIITYYEKPGRDYPKGREIVMADTDGGKILHNGDLVYDFIPIVQFKCKSVPGQFYGKSVIEELIPLQRSYNMVKNLTHEHIKRISVGGLLVEEGSMDVDKLEKYGTPDDGIFEYKQGRNKPDRLQIDNLPGEVLQEMERLENDMEYVAGVSQLQMIGAAPSGITSGSAIESLREIDNTRMAMTGEYMRESVIKLGVMVLKLYKKFTRLPRVMEYTGMGDMGNALIWTGEDIQSFEVDFETENELVLSEEMQLQRFKEAVELGYYTDETGQTPQRVKNMGLEKLKLGRYSELLGINSLSISQAQRETTYMRNGMFCDINSYDDDQIHAEEHKRFILSLEFEMLKRRKPQWAELILAHYQAHEARIQETKAAQTPVQM
ncbi:MAG: hypothetical protein ACI3XA_04660 [Clostridia bacterium]